MIRTRRILSNAIKQIADNFKNAYANPYEEICDLNKELVRDTLTTVTLGIFISYGIVGLLILLKKLFRSNV
ncbi:MAG: hypothetical protein IJ526_07175 [Lachnospiraceae bacterium]|nr:hypothetical protein [Lachnospiraceae bacterium]